MKLCAVLFSLATGLFTIQSAQAADDTITLALDVAMNANTLRLTRLDWGATGPYRGDTFIVDGRVYGGFSIPDGDTTNNFAPDPEGSIGVMICRGYFTADGVDIAAGTAVGQVATTQLFLLQDGSGLVTEGIEGAGPFVRAIVGGLGKYSGAVGQVLQEVLGQNGTGGRNLRLTFTFKVMTPPDPAMVEQFRSKTRLGRR